MMTTGTGIYVIFNSCYLKEAVYFNPPSSLVSSVSTENDFLLIVIQNLCE